MTENDASNWYLVTGLIFGLAIGLVISLLILPATNREVLPTELSASAKNEYRLMIANSFQTNYNLERASSRLALLGDSDSKTALIMHAQEIFASGGLDDDARALAELSAALITTKNPPNQSP